MDPLLRLLARGGNLRANRAEGSEAEQSKGKRMAMHGVLSFLLPRSGDAVGRRKRYRVCALVVIGPASMT